MIESNTNKSPLVLMADDDDMIRNITAMNLESEGFQVKAAADGQEALDLFEEKLPDIILLDVNMPKYDGFEVCAQIRQKEGGENLPILMITGQDDIESIRKSYQVGATDFIVKPVKWIILTQRIQYMLRAGNILNQFKKNEAHLANAQSIAQLGSWEMDIADRSFWCSRQTRRIFDLDIDQSIIPEKTFLETIHPMDQDRLIQLLEKAIETGQSFDLDHRILLPNKKVRFVTQKIDVPLDKDGNRKQAIGTIQDISQRKLLELFERDRNRTLELIIRGEALKNILDQLVQMASTQKSRAKFLLSIIKEQKLYKQAAINISEQLLEALEGQSVGPDQDGYGVVAYIDKPVFVTDIQTHSLWKNHRNTLANENIQSSCSFPITSGDGQILGILNMFQVEKQSPNDDDIELLEKICRLASIAIERHRLLEQVEYQSRYDVLTGLPNRSSISDFLHNAISLSNRLENKIAMFSIGLDRFKQVNDSAGHYIGDLLLKKVSKQLGQLTHRDTDLIGRMGGDEFICILTGIDNINDVASFAQKIVDTLADPFLIEGSEFHTTASIGIVVFPEDGDNVVTLQKNADIAMFYAKTNGGNRHVFFSEEMNTATSERYKIENELRKAIENNEFEVHYQPKFSIQATTLCGFEALVRWRHPEMGLISPAKFIPIAEESRLVIPIGTWILKEVCRQIIKWEKVGFGPYKIAVNVSIEQFVEPDFLEIVETTLKETQLDTKWLELEITEGILIKDVEKITETLDRLQEMGVNTAIDDFGTGYSSLSYLNKLNVNTLKIDQSFVFELENSDQTKTLIKTILSLAKNLHLEVVAEGVETEYQLKWLQENECQIGQGFLFSPPKTVNAIEKEFYHKK